MKFGMFIMLIFILLFELSIADSVLSWETKPFLIYVVILLITLWGIWKTKPRDE